MNEKSGGATAPAQHRWTFRTLVMLTLIGLLLRSWRQPVLPGTYDPHLDPLLYSGQRLLDGQLLLVDLLTGFPPLTQFLYAPSAWIGSLQGHRLLILLVDGLAGLLLARALRGFVAIGLLPLVPGSLLPGFTSLLYLIAAQTAPEALSGLPTHFASAFLVLALDRMRASVQAPSPPGLPLLLSTGFALGLALGTCPRLLSSMVLVVATGLVVVLPGGQLRLTLWPLGAGALLGTLLPLLPILLQPDGPAIASAGMVVLPIEQAWPPRETYDPLWKVPLEVLGTRLVGLPLWALGVVSMAGIIHLLFQRFRSAPERRPGPVLLAGLSLLLVVDVLIGFHRDGWSRDELGLLVLPLVLLFVTGAGELEGAPGALPRRLARPVVLILLLILINNIFVPAAFHAAPRPSESSLALEHDRERVRRDLLTLPLPHRSFASPQDVALLREIGTQSSTQGIGPDWSLNQQGLKASWATRKLGLPTDIDGVCADLLRPGVAQVVWMRTDPEGPNTAAFLKECLAKDGRPWKDLSHQIGLRSGEIRLFRSTEASQAP